MPAPLPDELRQRAVDAYLGGEGSYKEIAERFDVSHGSLEDWVRRHRRTGSVSANEWERRGRSPQINEEKQQVLKQLIEEKNDATLDELKVQLKAEGIKVSLSTICRTLVHKLGLTRKKKTSTRASVTGPTTKKNAKPSSSRSKTSRAKISTFSTKRARTSA